MGTPELKQAKVVKPQVVNLDDFYNDEFLSTPFSNKGSSEKDAISVEDQDLNIAVMASLKSSKESNFINGSKVVKPEEVNETVNLDDRHRIPLSNKGNTPNNAISVEEYGEDRDLNISITPDLTSNKEANFIDLSSDYLYYYDVDDDIKVLDVMPQAVTSRKRKDPAFSDSVTEKGQSSNSQIEPHFVCEICFEPATLKKLFLINGCTHSECTDCIVKYVASKLEENISKICCPMPDCKGVLEPGDCRSFLPVDVYHRWGDALCEGGIRDSHKFYCPFKDCSAMFIHDGNEVIRESECHNCRRMFCAQCKVPWHSEISCQEFKMLHNNEREREDILLMNLAKNKNWKRCPKCRIFVERIAGCRFMRCRCGIHFCYACGSTDVDNKTHRCLKCEGIL